MEEKCSGMCMQVFKDDVLNVLRLLFQKEIKLKISKYDTTVRGYVYLDERSVFQFLCHNFQCVKSLQNCANEDNIYELAFFRLEGGKVVF
jgi:hypothetical protein